MKKKKNEKQNAEAKSTPAAVHHGSTTQGGSNFGQGSQDLSNKTAKQGSESNEGANYDGEAGWDNEALRFEDIKKQRNEARSPDERKSKTL